VNGDGRPRGNQLLARLPSGEYERLQPDLELLSLREQDVLVEPGEPLADVWFPVDSVISVLVPLRRGPAEAATIGREGAVALSVFLGADSVSRQTICQVAGTAFRMPVPAFRAELERGGELRATMARYAAAFVHDLLWSVACNRRHALEQRYSRWLLMTHDRVGRDDLELTHEFLALMLGVRRTSISLTSQQFERAGFIRSGRARLAIVNRAGLEERSCECYAAIRAEYDRLLA
jgi:CRP-like cAMP-binding protein